MYKRIRYFKIKNKKFNKNILILFDRLQFRLKENYKNQPKKIELHLIYDNIEDVCKRDRDRYRFRDRYRYRYRYRYRDRYRYTNRE